MTKKRPRKKALRLEIAALEIIRALEAHVRGDHLMKDSQVAVALALLKKRLPDLAAAPAPKKGQKSPARHEDRLKHLI